MSLQLWLECWHGTASTADYPSVSVEICSSVIGVVSRPLAAGLRQFDTRRRFITSLVTAAVSDERRHSAPRRGSSISLRSFVSCTDWRLQSVLHSNNQSSCTSVYTVCTCIPYWRALSGGRCRGSSVTPFQFIFIIDCQPHCTRLLTVGDRAFPAAAAHVWNSLPDLVTSAPSVAVFRSWLKMHLFNISYLCDCTAPARWL